MGENKIKLGSERYAKSTNVDTNIKIGLNSNKNKLTEYDVSYVLKTTQLYDDERQASNDYQLYGSFEYLSLLNNLKGNYEFISDLFTRSGSTEIKTLENSFKVYLVKPASEFTHLDEDIYQRKFEIISKLDNVDIIKASYGKNIFNEEKYNLIINNKIDLTDQYDGLGLPITELFLYCEYQPSENGVGDKESVARCNYNIYGEIVSKTNFTPVELSIGDIINGDAISFNTEDFQINIVNDYVHRIKTMFYQTSDISGELLYKSLYWLYNPFISIPVDYFSDDISKASIEGTTYDDVSSIPNYAKPMTDENNTYVWRELIEKGFTDPLTDRGFAPPFINNKHYIYNNFILKVIPDYSDTTTTNLFTEMKFGEGINIGNTPIDDLDEFGKSCK